MFPRSEAEAAAAHDTVDLIVGDGAPYALAKLFNGGERAHPVVGGRIG
ncbi:MAG: hypothetical protein ACRDRN_00835 [Sciscionella sp.]